MRAMTTPACLRRTDRTAVPTRRRKRPRHPPGGLLAAWRTRPPGSVTRREAGRIAALLAATEILHEPRWRAARNGDAAAAAAVAIDRLRRSDFGSRPVDAVMSNLLVLAVRGDATAPVILAHALAASARLAPADATLARLAGQWRRRFRPGGAAPRPPRHPA
jgi:hypothetical protein